MSSESDKPSPVRVHIVVAGKEEEAGDDVHYCGKCKLVFTNIKDYVEHKVSHDQCSVTYSRSEQDRCTLVPTLVLKKTKIEKVTAGHEDIPSQAKDAPIKRRAKRTYVDESLITEKVMYSCVKCSKGFHRIAALKRHLEYDHETEDNLEEDADLEEAESLQTTQTSSTGNNNNSDTVEEISEELEPGDGNTEDDEEYKPAAKRAKKKAGEKAERSHTCEVCGNKFKEANVLKSHLLTHTNQRDFTCPMEGCGYAFKTKGSLKRHERRHTGEKPYSCKLCGRNFSESGALTRHMKSRTPCTAKSDTDLPRYGKRWGFDSSMDIKPSIGNNPSGEPPHTENNSDENVPAKNSSTLNSPTKSSAAGNSATKVSSAGNSTISPTKNSSVEISPTKSSSAENPPSESSSAENPETEFSSETRVDLSENTTEGGDCDVAAELPVNQSTASGEYDIQEEEDEAQEGTVELTRESECADDQAAESTPDLSDTPIIIEQDWPPNFCRVCRNDYETEEDLKLHLKLHLADTPFRCELCHFVAEKRDELLQHMQNIHGTPMKAFWGTPCLQVFEHAEGEVENTFQDHDKILRDAKTAVQQLLELQGEPGEVRHSPSIHGDKTVHTCRICSRTFRGQSYVNQHMKSHTGERPYKCVICEKTFTCKDTLTKHIVVHSSERQYKCGECGKLFKRISHVREHLKIHSGERPFQCSVCDKTFKTLNASKVHARIHSTVLPYECTFCHRHFREKGSLQRHIRMHTGEKPFKCHFCGRAFAEHGTLSRHLKAKVSCARQLAVTQQQEGGFPTVLAEFSSVVADTQHYIVPDNMGGSHPVHHQEGTEYVVLHGADIPVETLENVEIIATGEDGESMILNATGAQGDSAQYVVVSEADDNLRVLDSRTGQTVAMMPAHVVTSSEVESEMQAVAMHLESNQIEAVAMNPESNQIEAVAMNPESNEIEIVAMNSDGNHIEAVAMETVVMNFDGNRIEAVAMNPSISSEVEPVVLMQNVHQNETMNDAIQQAMLAADAMEDHTEVITVTTEIEMEGETVSST